MLSYVFLRGTILSITSTITIIAIITIKHQFLSISNPSRSHQLPQINQQFSTINQVPTTTNHNTNNANDNDKTNNEE